MKSVVLFAAFLLFAACSNSEANKKETDKKTVELQNPILPGYFADPSLVQHEGKFYMYVTADPWGTDFLSCWESDDFQNWTFNKLNWPTKEVCTSPTSRPNKVWAPSVIKKGDMFYMYVSVGSEVWCGKASHPLGPWGNMLGDKPMISDNPGSACHVIDAEVFIDEDERIYLYWGSGWNWVNGVCMAAELNDDMSTFKNEPVEVTPTRYFEAPWMIKHNGKYYLTYSEGKTIDETYEVRCAVGDNPLGPFTESENSPILKVNDNLQVYGPGHHAFFAFEGRNYILYHRHRLPFERGSAYRQTCINEFTFDDEKIQINNIFPYHTQAFPDLIKEPKNYIFPDTVMASSEQADYTIVANILDNCYGTRWESGENDEYPELKVTFKESKQINSMEIRFEYPWKTYFTKIEISSNGNDWEIIADYTIEGVSGSPVIVPVNKVTKFVKTSFVKTEKAAKPAIWEIKFY